MCLVGLGGSARAIETGLEVGFGAGSSSTLGDVVFVSPLLELGAPISQDFALQVVWGLTVATANAPAAGLDGTTALMGNPLVAFPWRLGEGLVFAPGIALPVASLPDDGDPGQTIAVAAVNGGRAIRGRVDEWLWLPDELSFVFPIHFATYTKPILIEVDAAIAYVVPMTKADPDDDFLLQIAGRVAWRIVPRLWLGVRLASTFIPTNTGDNSQSSVAPDLRWMFPLGEGGGYLGLRWQINLDTPYGPSFDANRVWGIHLGFGASY